MNKKGYTLVELLATIIVLSIVIGITIPVTISVINKNKEKQDQILLKNIKSAVVNLVEECNFSTDLDICNNVNDNLNGDVKTTYISELVEYGFLSNNGKDTIVEGFYQVIRPSTNSQIGPCRITITKDGSYCLDPPYNGSTNENNMCYFLASDCVYGND